MAKNDPTPNATNAGKVFRLVKESTEKVESKIFSYRLATDTGIIEVPKANLMTKKTVTVKLPDGTTKQSEEEDYRFQVGKTVPCLNAAAITDRASLRAAMDSFMDAVEAYDAADQIASFSGANTAQRTMNLAVNTKGEKIGTVPYIVRLIKEAHTLGLQKQLQKPLRKLADDTLRQELNAGTLTKKPRAAKAGTVMQDEDEVLG